MPSAVPAPHNQPLSPYLIGSCEVPKPLVSVEQVEDHLQLLAAFHDLRIIVEEGKDQRIPGFAKQMNPESRWQWFVYLATDR